MFVHRPHARRRFLVSRDALPAMPSTVRFESNADGERAGPVPTDPEGTLRVLVAGGSAAECYMLDQDVTWPARLEAELRDDPRIARPVHVGNVARSLIACRQIEAVLAAALPTLPLARRDRPDGGRERPRLVVRSAHPTGDLPGRRGRHPLLRGTPLRPLPVDAEGERSLPRRAPPPRSSPGRGAAPGGTSALPS